MELIVLLVIQVLWVWYMKSEYFGKWDTCKWLKRVLSGVVILTMLVIALAGIAKILHSTPEAGEAIAQSTTDRIVAYTAHEIPLALGIDIGGSLFGFFFVEKIYRRKP